MLFAANNRLLEAAIFVLIGIFFDFFDGLAARMLKVQSDLGKELDSLADVVTSGVVPGIVMYQLFKKAIHKDWSDGLSCEIGQWKALEDTDFQLHLLPFFGLLLTLAAAYRLAKFNLDTRQTTSFIGLPTPAMALFVLSLPLILTYNSTSWVSSLISNKYVLIGLTIILSFFMHMEVELFSLKFKNFSWKNSWTQIVFLFISVAIILVFKFVAIPFVILLYILISIFKKLVENREIGN